MHKKEKQTKKQRKQAWLKEDQRKTELNNQCDLFI